MSDAVTTSPVASLHGVLAALADPVRMEMVRRLHATGAPMACAELYDGITKATASHHFKVLREAGITARADAGAHARQTLCAADLDAAFPGLLESVLSAAQREAEADLPPEVPTTP